MKIEYNNGLKIKEHLNSLKAKSETLSIQFMLVKSQFSFHFVTFLKVVIQTTINSQVFMPHFSTGKISLKICPRYRARVYYEKM